MSDQSEGTRKPQAGASGRAFIPNRPKSRTPERNPKSGATSASLWPEPGLAGSTRQAHQTVAAESDGAVSVTAPFASFRKKNAGAVGRLFDEGSRSDEGRRRAGARSRDQSRDAEASAGKKPAVCERRTRLGGFNSSGFGLKDMPVLYPSRPVRV